MTEWINIDKVILESKREQFSSYRLFQSLDLFFNKNGYLTTKQREALKNMKFRVPPIYAYRNFSIAKNYPNWLHNYLEPDLEVCYDFIGGTYTIDVSEFHDRWNDV